MSEKDDVSVPVGGRHAAAPPGGQHGDRRANQLVVDVDSRGGRRYARLHVEPVLRADGAGARHALGGLLPPHAAVDHVAGLVTTGAVLGPAGGKRGRTHVSCYL